MCSLAVCAAGLHDHQGLAEASLRWQEEIAGDERSVPR